MSDKENFRKCFKCGKSPATDNIKLFRFPKPGVRNIFRCTLWAKYSFPAEDEKYTSIAFHKKLFSEHRMLCQNHFADEDFYDDSKKKLLNTAIPSDTGPVTMQLPAYFNEEPQPGPSGSIPEHAQPQATSRSPLKSISNTVNMEVSIPAAPEQKREIEKANKQMPKCLTQFKKICQLRNQLKRLKKKALLNALTEDKCIKKLSKKLTPTFALLLQSQIRNFQKKSTGHRWTKEEKIMALRLYKRSPTCYRLLRRLFELPSPSTLKGLLNKVPFSVGVVTQVIEILKDNVKQQKPSDNEYILVFDEMSIQKHFNYNKKEDKIDGYQDHGTQGRSSIVASYALTFMIVGIRRKVKQPLAHYFSSSFSTADRLAVLIKEILHQCFEAGIKISATVCDMDGVNRKALSILGATTEHPFILVDNKEIVTLYDVPHLLKCFRNLFMKYNIECLTNILSDKKSGKGVAKWSHIEEFHELDKVNPNFVFAPALTKYHLNPDTKQKMRVKLAAQVLSHTVAAGMYAKVSDGSLTPGAVITAGVLAKIDKLFDCLNSDSSDLRRGKSFATNMTDKSPHLQLFSEMKTFFNNIKFIGSPRRPPSQDGWIWSINAVERLYRNLKTAHNIKSLATRRLTQDPIENLFGCIRQNCGSNTSPTTEQFVAGLKTAIISSLAHIGTSGNCEADNNVIINNMSKLLSISQSSHTEVHGDDFNAVEFNEDMEIPENTEDNSEIQACAYVCGFLLKRIPSINCRVCRQILISSSIDKSHMFVEYKEYSEKKRSLNYASKDMILCVESCASLANSFLAENAHTDKLKAKVTGLLKRSINFDFMNKCGIHRSENINFLVNSVFFICVKRFCVYKNRMFADEASQAKLKRKMNIILHK